MAITKEHQDFIERVGACLLYTSDAADEEVWG